MSTATTTLAQPTDLTPAAAVTLPAGSLDSTLTTEDLTILSDLLTAHSVHHDTLRVGPTNFNHSATDLRNVFVKVTRPGAGSHRARTEVEAASWAQQHDLRVAPPLLASPFDFADSNGAPRSASVWQWVSFCTAPALVDRVKQVAAVIAQIHATPAPPNTAALVPTFWRNSLHARLAPLGQASDAVVLRNLSDALAEQIAERWDARPTGWVHGDLHLGNVGWLVNGRPAVYDWESSTTAPVEVDVAQLLRSVFVHPRDYPRAELQRIAQKGIAAIDAAIDVDWALVKVLIHARAVASMSLLPFTGNIEDFQANQALLADPLHWLPSA